MTRSIRSPHPTRLRARLAVAAGVALLAAPIAAVNAVDGDVSSPEVSAVEVSPEATTVGLPPEEAASDELASSEAEYEIEAAVEEGLPAGEEGTGVYVPPPLNWGLMTATPASATAAWPAVWGEGPPAHRALMASMENVAAPSLDGVQWVTGGAPSLVSPEMLTVLGYWPRWAQGGTEDISEISQSLSERSPFDLKTQLVLVHPNTTSEELGATLLDARGTIIAGIDADGSIRRAYGVDSYPDFTLIGDGGVVICADVRREHLVNAVDACIQGWRPWNPASPEAEASPESVASPEANWRIEISPTPGARPLTPEERARILEALAAVTASGASIDLQVTGDVSPEALASPEITASPEIAASPEAAISEESDDTPETEAGPED